MDQKDFILALRKKLQHQLPGEESHFKMIPHERRPDVSYKGGNMLPVASSVLILLYPLDNFQGTILIKRTIDDSVHSGQISFPGGKREESDETLVQTALREAQEEIGITPGNIEIIGSLSPLYVSPSNFEIMPVVGYSDKPVDLRPNPAEVDLIIELSLSGLNACRAEKDIEVRGYLLRKVPCFNFNGHIIWGATAMILQELQDVIKSIEQGV
jgi:8-oxo-dGTP pyrophosphatase MutT (NUDIX family)